MTEKSDVASQKVTPRDAQKGGQGAVGKEHPEILLKQDTPQTGSTPPLNEMPGDLTPAQIGLLCEVDERDLSKLTGDKKRDLERLVSEGYVAPVASLPGSRFQLTAKGGDFLGKRGVGLNEA